MAVDYWMIIVDWKNKFFCKGLYSYFVIDALMIGDVSYERNCCKSADVWQQERHCRQRQIRDQLAAYNLDVSTRSAVRSPFCLSQSHPSMNARSCRSLSEEGRWD